MKINNVEISILVKGRSIDEYQHEDQVWVEGRPNSDFSIKLKNLTSSEKSVIVSVDGLDVLTGKPAGTHSPAHLLKSYESYEIRGWATKLGEVARFVFSKIKEEKLTVYSKISDSVGSIGVMVFGKDESFNFIDSSDRWKQRYVNNSLDPHRNIYEMGPVVWSSRTGYAPVARMSADVEARPELGTGWGEIENIQTQPVTQASGEHKVGVMFYDTKRGLIERGVIKKEKSLPNPFPGIGCEPPKTPTPEITVDEFLKSIRDLPEKGCYDNLTIADLSHRMKLAFELKNTRTMGIRYLQNHLQELLDALNTKS